MEELHYLDAATALRLFRARELSPVELMNAVIARTEEVNGEVNALTETLFDDALTAARLAEARYARSADDAGAPPALLGLPVATKEKHSLAGRTIEQGLGSHRGRIAAADHPVVARIRAAGGIVHARTASPEFSCATVTHSPLWGVTRNPWNLDRSPGGSSGGAGAALAAGFASLATASDIAGSTRIPAGFTGTVGYKAPYGRVPGAPPLSADWYRGDGPMARTVADAALLANVMSGPDAGDHSTVPAGEPIPSAHAPVAGMRIALSVTLGNFLIDPAVEANTRAVAAALRDAGADVVEVALPWTTDQVRETIFTHFGHILGPAMAAEIAGGDAPVAAYTTRFIADAAAAAARNTLAEGLAMDARIQAELAAAMSGFDALLCPTSGVASLDAAGDYLTGIDAGGRHLEHYWEAHLTSPFNVANRCPVLAVPSGFASDGVPTSVQVVGHSFAEGSVFRVGAAIEALMPWAHHRPSFRGSRLPTP
ncbi:MULTISPECIES: amidase [unclassified Arthrobacter]|uniref:amidase n=1 Tax=unclassified Arthrobacter TaxID=235627 RepID=UPI002E04D54E|nr:MULTISPECIES: amidase [unclassified Arthrobacter]MEC5191737.1 aspartyl-tRNA(Asn)/glutamyl-tRNA(Gln) amidotransferase subunit A [Arthrobacter sp. MP_M4]MEC5203427.1 aspartyl-tRNA(Asn)/glutamyl-tRNA(Gln) amidotransferase subunit A [Arthrobacter sp. MP_M7]